MDLNDIDWGTQVAPGQDTVGSGLELTLAAVKAKAAN